jgi:2-hydroxy-3-keto-5-methylthiopentenyl-1-phosphate phosphatase
MKPVVIFCDFDGTITLNDNIIAIMKHFQPAGWTGILDKAMNQEISIKQTIGSMFALLPSSLKDNVIHFALDNMQIRPGFAEFLSFCEEQQFKFFVTSGGIDFFVYPTLLPFGIEKSQIYCNESNFNQAQIAIEWPYPCDEHCSQDCGMCKATLIRSYPADQHIRILIGDSLTDFAGARLADYIFARSHLAVECSKLNMPYYPYESFFEVIEQLTHLKTTL